MKGAKIRFRPSKEEEEEIMEQLNEAEEIGQKLLAERMSKNGIKSIGRRWARKLFKGIA
jgi:hypothetical protein